MFEFPPPPEQTLAAGAIEGDVTPFSILCLIVFLLCLGRVFEFQPPPEQTLAAGAIEGDVTPFSISGRIPSDSSADILSDSASGERTPPLTPTIVKVSC